MVYTAAILEGAGLRLITKEVTGTMSSKRIGTRRSGRSNCRQSKSIVQEVTNRREQDQEQSPVAGRRAQDRNRAVHRPQDTNRRGDPPILANDRSRVVHRPLGISRRRDLRILTNDRHRVVPVVHRPQDNNRRRDPRILTILSARQSLGRSLTRYRRERAATYERHTRSDLSRRW